MGREDMKKIISFIVLISVLFLGQTCVFANSYTINDSSKYQFVKTGDLVISDPITRDTGADSIISRLIGVAAYLCYAAAVIVVLVKGVQLMNASPEGKAELKKQLVAAAVGGLIVFGIGGILQILSNVVATIF